MPGEELVYNVSFASFDIGRVKVSVKEEIQRDGKTSFKTRATIDSYKGVPFVDLHYIYESIIDQKVFSLWFREIDKNHPQRETVTYSFDYGRKVAIVRKHHSDTVLVQQPDTVRVDTIFQDGLSLFYYARANVASRGEIFTPTMIKGKPEKTFFRFQGEREKEEIDAVDYPVDVLAFEGKAEFVGIFGLTGGFEGWFSNDEAHIPILAKMKVLIGSIRIELVEWKRNGWSPPRYGKK